MSIHAGHCRGFSAAAASDALVSVGSPPDQTPRNHQNEPAVAIDPSDPSFAVAGWIDYVDRAPCPQADATAAGRCSRTASDNPPIGGSAVGFSFDSGKSWIQPAYTGLTGSDCAPTAPCEYHQGPIHTVPWYYENGLASWGDSGVAVGPIPVNGHFSWANGSRVYYSNLATAGPEPFALPNPEFRGDLAAVVSRLDNPTPETVLDKASWKPPVLVSERHGQAGGHDKNQIWVDNAASSPYFGRVYECYSDFRSVGGGDGVPLGAYAAFSSDGGDSWTTNQVGPVDANGHGEGQWGQTGCAIRTDSHGVVYLFNDMGEDPALVALPTHSTIVLQKSFDGGRSWTKAQTVRRTTDDDFFYDPISGRAVIDGYAGARTDLAWAPSVDIANGAPTGADATNEIVLSGADNGQDFNDNTAQLTWSLNGGDSWSAPTTASPPADRPLYAATAISPSGDRVYAAYEAVTSPWRGDDMTSPRPYHGVLLTAPVGANGAPGAWSTVYNGSTDTTAGHNDVRASYPGHDLYQERVGDYVYAAATRTHGLGIWIDARNATVCGLIQDWRAKTFAAGQPVFPAPWPLADCPNTFGNTDVWSATGG
jgi:hypothetical protein